MNPRYSRLLSITVIGGTPFLIAGLFVYRYPFAGNSVHPARTLFLASSLMPAIASMALAIGIQLLPRQLSPSNKGAPKTGRAPILAAIALVLVLWGAIAATETWLRLLYFSLWAQHAHESSAMSVSSILMGVVATILILGLTIQPGAANPNHQAA